LETQQPFVIDNTNPSGADRAKYIEAAKNAQYSIVGYYFRSKVEDCLERNETRVVRVPEVGILSTARKLELPSMDEGFGNLRYVRLTESGFVVEEWNNDVVMNSRRRCGSLRPLLTCVCFPAFSWSPVWIVGALLD